MQISDKIKEYLIDSLMRDKENLEREVKIKEDIIAKLGVEHGKEKTLTDDWKHKYFKLEEENCELKKKVKRLENDKTFHINELQKNNNAIKEVEELKIELKNSNDSWKEVYDAHNKLEKEKEDLIIENEELKEKIKAQESEILKLTMQNIGKEVKRGRPAKKD